MNNTTVLIPLERGWVCVVTANPPLISLVARLSTWHDEQARIATLSRDFALEPTDFCVSYLLVIDRAPDGTHVTVNDCEVGVAGHSGLRVDVTEFVALEQNTISLRVEGGAQGAFAGVRLQGMPCE